VEEVDFLEETFDEEVVVLDGFSIVDLVLVFDLAGSARGGID